MTSSQSISSLEVSLADAHLQLGRHSQHYENGGPLPSVQRSRKESIGDRKLLH